MNYSNEVLLASERNWLSQDSLERIRKRASDQSIGILFPELSSLAVSGTYFLHIPKTAGTSTNRFFGHWGSSLQYGFGTS